MDQAFYTFELERSDAPEPMTTAWADRAERAPLYGQWVDEEDNPLGERFEVPVEPGSAFELFGDESPHWQPTPASLKIPAPVDQARRASRLQLSEGDRPVAQLPLAAMTRFDPLGPPRLTARFGEDSATREMRVFAERFTDFARFEDSVRELHRHFLSRRPFGEDAVKAKLGLRGYFWPSDPDRGLFDTPDPPTRLFHGNRSAAWSLLYPHLQLDLPAVVLIDSTVGGGAGGSRASGGTPGHLAWASIAEIPSYPWPDVALHELGHAFGLADEYVSSDGLDYSVYRFDGQPNISETRDRATIAWSGQLTTQADADGIDSPQNIPQAEWPRTVGVFAGAFYRSGWYRPSPDCLMRKLSRDFCPVCTRALRAKVTAL